MHGRQNKVRFVILIEDKIEIYLPITFLRKMILNSPNSKSAYDATKVKSTSLIRY